MRKDNNVINCIGLLYAEQEIELSWLIKQGWSLTKTRKDNDMTNHIGAVYAEIKTELLWLII